MRIFRTWLGLWVVLAQLVALGGPTANEVIAAAKTKAAAENKSIFLAFGASWCGWCKKLDAYVKKPEVKAVLDKHFVWAHLDVMENEALKDLENAGGVQEMERLGGKDAGLPFFAFLDGRGQKIISSIRPEGGKGMAGNIGFPGTPEELEWFVKMIKQAAPSIKESDLQVLQQAVGIRK